MQDLLRKLPKVDELLQAPEIFSWVTELNHTTVVNAIREAIAFVRSAILAGNKLCDVEREVFLKFNELINKQKNNSLRRVLNGTGVILHTNLGRAKLAQAAREQIEQIASSYSTLEYNLESGKRGSRYDHVVDLLKQITGAEDALVVNNNAAAVLLALNTLARGREAIVSRGQLIEIGGSFRIPAVMEQSGCLLHEVGTTNKTHLFDFEQAINENTALILKVHTSNYRIMGFTDNVSTEDLVALGEKYKIPLLEDLGSGMLIDTHKIGLSYEPTVSDVVTAGADVITFSGDKLLGGPQAGIIVGKKQYIEAMKKNHLNRALRIDKLTLAALEATLRLYLDEDTALREIPILNMLAVSTAELAARAEQLREILIALLKDFATVEVIKTASQVGGGAFPLERVASIGLFIVPKKMSVNACEELLRFAETPVIVRIENDGIVIDIRTIARSEESELLDILAKVFVEG